MNRLALVAPVIALILGIAGCGEAERPATAPTASAAPAPAKAAPAATAPTASAAPAAEKPAALDTSHYFLHAAPNPDATVAYRWVDIIEEAAARRVDKVGAKPTIISRDMMISCTGMYDAWACYDEKAVGTRLGGTLRRPAEERTQANRELAISYAVTRCLEDLYPEDLAWIDQSAVAMGVDPANHSTDAATPAGVGNTVAAALIEYRHKDGANQLGDEPGSNGKPYSDYTGYKTARSPDEEPDPNHWAPIPFSDGKGGTIRPGFLTPHWFKVKPLGLDAAEQFRPGPPPQADTDQMRKEVDEVIDANGHLSLEQKAIVEFMRDGPRSTGQSGHWLLFAQDLSRRDHYGLDQDVKLFFCVGAVAFDAFISCWETKRFYDSSRPYWYVRYNRKGQMIRGYAGPGQGVKQIPADHWHPYSPDTFVTPPFPGYTSGHATVSGASAKILELFSGSDRFECVAKRVAGALTEAGVPTAQMQAVDGKPATDVPADAQIDLPMRTFSYAAEMAALSRMLGGYHIRTDNEVGLACGRKIGEFCFARYQAFFNGTVPEPK
jgi:hypothetical protein